MTETPTVRQTDEGRERQRLTDADAYRVARMVCEKYLSANRIAHILYPDEYNSKKKQDKSRAIMRVKHLLRRAADRGILTVTPPPNERLAGELRKRPEFRDIRFEVVDDWDDSQLLDPAEAVYREAARLVAEKIGALMREKKGPVVVGNAGGPALSRLAEYLPAVSMDYEDAASRLCFISLNAARSADRYDLSANFVAVRMAAIFGGRHIASLRRMPEKIKRQHDVRLREVDLLVCGSGAKTGFLGRWLKEVCHVNALPKSVVGDICLIPIDDSGKEVGLTARAAKSIREDLRPEPPYDELKRLASQDKVLVVFAYPPTAPGDQAAGVGTPASKTKIATAILRQPLTKWCVLGSSLAEQVLSFSKAEHR